MSTSPDESLHETLEELRSYVGQPLTDMPSPLGSWLAAVLNDVGDDGFEVRIVVRHEMTNPMGVLHGGIIAAIADEMMGSTLVLYLGQPFASVNLAVDFLASVHEGETVLARSQIVRKGKRIVNTQCTLRNEKGELVARATSNLVAMGG